MRNRASGTLAVGRDVTVDVERVVDPVEAPQLDHVGHLAKSVESLDPRLVHAHAVENRQLPVVPDDGHVAAEPEHALHRDRAADLEDVREDFAKLAVRCGGKERVGHEKWPPRPPFPQLTSGT